MKKIILQISLTWFILVCTLTGQENKGVNLPELYNKLLCEYLFPAYDTTSLKEVFLFIEKPSFSPEFSIRILADSSKATLESFSLSQSLWEHIVMTVKETGMSNNKPEVSYFSNQISIRFLDHFMEEIHTILDKAIDYKKQDNKNVFHFDGKRYYFRLFEAEEYEFTSHDHNPFLNELVAIATEIANQLRNGSFSERKIISLLSKYKIDHEKSYHYFFECHNFQL